MDSIPKDMIDAIKGSIENNASDSPHLSIDPETTKPAVLGDPTKLPEKRGDYSLAFVYSPDEVTEADREKLKYDDKNNLYIMRVEFTGKRIKPLYRAQILIILGELLEAFGILTDEGYTSDLEALKVTQEVLKRSEQLADLAHLIVGISKEQAEHMTPAGAIGFLRQLFDNEPNIIGESSNFLSSSLGN